MDHLVPRHQTGAARCTSLKLSENAAVGYGLRQRYRSSADIYESFQEHFAQLDREHFVVLLLDAKNCMLGFQTVSVGSLTSSLVHPREVYKPIVLDNDLATENKQSVITGACAHGIRASAAAMILMHSFTRPAILCHRRRTCTSPDGCAR